MAQVASSTMKEVAVTAGEADWSPTISMASESHTASRMPSTSADTLYTATVPETAPATKSCDVAASQWRVSGSMMPTSAAKGLTSPFCVCVCV